MPAPTSAALQVLHTHSTMSMLDGASRIEDYLKHCKRNCLCGCGITDHGYLMGLHDLLTTSKKKDKEKNLIYGGVKPIAGCEFYMMPREDHVFAGKQYNYFHITIWAKNLTGYKNLMALGSRAWEDGRIQVMPFGRKVPRITMDDLALFNEGLICGSGCIEGPFGKPMRMGETDDAIKNINMLHEIFGDRLFFELMPHSVSNNYRKDECVEVNVEGGYLLRFHPDDVLETDRGTLAAKDLVEIGCAEIIRATPIRTQEQLLSDELGRLGLTNSWANDRAFGPDIGGPIEAAIPIAGSWKMAKGRFLGNECNASKINGCEQLFVNRAVVDICRQLKGKLLMTLDAHFVNPEDKDIQDILLQNGNKDGWRFSTSYYQMGTEQAWENWERYHATIPGYEAAFIEGVEHNTTLVDMVEVYDLPKSFHLPDPELPSSISSRTDLDRNGKLEMMTYQRIIDHGRLPTDNEKRMIYLKRLRKEMDVIARNPSFNFLSYFLGIEQDITSYAMETGDIPGPGRGSAAGCLLAYLLKITHLDPIEWDLSFERFLSLGRIARGKFPDIDMDFGEPGKIVQHLQEKYGERFARICTNGTMKLKMAIKDVSRIVLQTQHIKENADTINDLCSTIENPPQGVSITKWLYGYTDDDGNTHAGYIESNEKLQSFFASHPNIKDMIDRLLDVPKSIGKHASAYCISDVPISEVVPMCKVSGESCTQFTMKPVEQLGLIKMDLLALNTMNDIKGCLKLIKERHGVDVDVYKIPHCERTMDYFCAGRTETVFQFKSSIATDLCKRIKPRSIEDLAQLTANGRPGTMQALMEDGKTTLIDAWVARRQGVMPVTYLHPDLEEVLATTHGIPCFQEQIMKIFMRCCGYSEEKSDEIREVIGKKQRGVMEGLLADIRIRLQNAGWSVSQIESFISLCVAASSYSFNRCLSLDTRVNSVRGTIEIADVEVGDRIEAYDHDTGQIHFVEVIDVMDSESELWEIELEDGKKITSSLKHKYMCEDGEMRPLSEILEKDLAVMST